VCVLQARYVILRVLLEAGQGFLRMDVGEQFPEGVMLTMDRYGPQVVLLPFNV
jgi:hypothetical protein